MQKTLKKSFSLVAMAALILQGLVLEIGPAFAASPGDIVINEVAWAGSNDNANDEWIELYNRSSQNVDLTGWVIEDDGTPGTKLSGTIAAHGYFLIEDSETVVSTMTADQIIGLSLANAGDSLALKDAAGIIIDKVNAGGGAWYAGDGTSKATMERLNPDVKEDVATNWAAAKTGNGSKSSLGSAIIGTPRTVNSNYAGSGPEVRFETDEVFANIGDTVNVGVYVDNATDLYAYGFEIQYPTTLLTFQSAQEAAFLKADGTTTAFNAGLKNNTPGNLVVGNARLLNPAKGVDGSGKLFDLIFKVAATESDSGEVTFGGGSFLADSDTDVLAKYAHLDVNINPASNEMPMIANLKIQEGAQRYSLALSWQEDLDGAATYIVKRKAADGTMITLGESADPSFLDSDAVQKGGKIVPGVMYNYSIVPVKNGVQGKAIDVSGKDTRGIVGDNDRSDNVNGKDIENLARSFGSVSADEEYNPLVDTNFDGIIDGKDLIDVGVNFGLVY